MNTIIFSQEKIKYCTSIDFNFSKGILKYKSISDNFYKNTNLTYTFETKHGFKYKGNILALGLGVDFWNNGILYPLSLNYKRGYVIKNQNFAFYMNFGFSPGVLKNQEHIYDDLHGKLFFNLGNEYDLTKFKNESKLLLGLNFKLQITEATYTRIINPFETPLIEHSRVNFKFLSLKLSYQF